MPPAAVRGLTAACVALASLATPVTFDNTRPVLDARGEILDAHDQSMRRFYPNGPYYRHAVAYGGCLEPNATGCDRTSVNCGFQANHSINVWRSADLSSGSWALAAVAIAPLQRPAGVVFRPSAVFNPNLGTVVLGWNFMSNGVPTAVSASGDPEGPFVYTGSSLNLTTGGVSDWAWFVDPADQKGYIIYSANFQIHIEQLTDDFLAVRGAPNNYTFAEVFVEAPHLFERKGVYYALFGWCCCFCKQGSAVIVHSAPHPLGPWTAQAVGPSYERGDIACVPKSGAAASSYAVAALGGAALGTLPTPGLGCEYKNSSETSITRAQQNSIWEVDTASGEVVYLWVGDAWQQAPDGVKGHDPQTVLRLVFDDANGGQIAKLVWQDSFELDVV
jgi:hypothetical protein